MQGIGVCVWVFQLNGNESSSLQRTSNDLSRLQNNTIKETNKKMHK